MTGTPVTETVLPFDIWRKAARDQLEKGIPEGKTIWSATGAQQAGLFDQTQQLASSAKTATKFSVSKDFMGLAETISCHSDPERWELLYTALWRLTHGEKHLLALQTDSLVRRLHLMEKAVRRDAHKAKAFVRFKLYKEGDTEEYIAWHQPDYDILPLVAGFFQRRFAVMNWAILTPQRSVIWDGNALIFKDGVPASKAPQGEDALEDVWRTYYRSTFNPARIKLDMMKREMPVRYWHTMPETDLIPSMLEEAPERVEAMIAYGEGMNASATDFMPADRSLSGLAEAAKHCEGCPLYRYATCTVFGTGPAQAKLMIVGEQPGDEEDRAGLPFAGPAGQVLNRALEEAEINRDDLYVTNAVKHFKFEQRGKRRIHQSPNVREINACRPWLNAEIEAVKPPLILALGATAVRSLLGPGYSIRSASGNWHPGPNDSKRRVSYHPSAILRAMDAQQGDILYKILVEDLKEAKSMV